jgi:hypothetical protein
MKPLNRSLIALSCTHTGVHVPILNEFDDFSEGDADPSNPTLIVSTSMPREFRCASAVDETKKGKQTGAKRATRDQPDPRRTARRAEDLGNCIIESELGVSSGGRSQKIDVHGGGARPWVVLAVHL